jgi:hypothetical protein
MELAIINKSDLYSMPKNELIIAICGAVLLTLAHIWPLFKTNDNIEDTISIDESDSETIINTTTTVNVTETVTTTVSSKSAPIKKLRPKVAPAQKVEVIKAVDPEVPNKNYLSSILKDNEDITIFIHLLNNTTMSCSAKYINQRIKITECDYIPSLVGCPFHTPTSLKFRLLTLLNNTKYKPALKQDMWGQMFVERNGKLVSIASLR